jgi:hypothetical protein
VCNHAVVSTNLVVSLSNHVWHARPSFDPRDKPEGKQALDEGGIRGEKLSMLKAKP